MPARHHTLESLPDGRKGTNTPYTIKDAALGAFAVCLTPSPSRLALQRTLPQTKGRSSATRLFRMAELPCDTQIRMWLDPVEPAQLFPLFEVVYAALERAGHVGAFRPFAGPRRMA